MTPDIVVDIGNSRIKWGRFDPLGRIVVTRLDPDDTAKWDEAVAGMPTPVAWAVASVHPVRLQKFVIWANGRGDKLRIVRSRHNIPLTLAIREPDSVGLDRLLGAVAAKARRRPGYAVVTADAGTALTLNYLDAEGQFRGGAILPGLRLMAAALHQYTAKLPMVNPEVPPPKQLGENTDEAIRLGIHLAIQGAVENFIRQFVGEYRDRVEFFLTGGSSAVLDLGMRFVRVPSLNLEGIRIAAEFME